MNSSSLDSRREHVLNELRNIKRLRRGQISEQLLTKKTAEGKLKEYGPYFVWQYYDEGKKCSKRIPSDELAMAREDLKSYERFKGLCEELAVLTEAMACSEHRGGKKNDRPRSAP